MKIKINIENNIHKNAIEVLKEIHSINKEAYIVGGAVRDILLKTTPKDFDIASALLPDEVSKLFPKVFATGEKYGTVTVLMDIPIEVTTFRNDVEYNDNRRPNVIKFSKTLKEDMQRRDFTINALALDINGKVIDFYNGTEDLKNKLIKAVGNPVERFNEDALRKLRAVRFAAVIDGEIETNTYKAILENPSLKGVSKERIREEFNKILLSKNPSKGIELLYKLRLLEQFIPEFCKTYGFNQRNPHHELDIFHHITKAVDNTPKILEVRLAAFFHDIGKPEAFTIDEKGIGHFYGHYEISYEHTKKILKRLKYSNDEIKLVSLLVKEHHSMPKGIKRAGIKRVISRVGVENMEYLFKLMRADRLGKKEINDLSDIEENYRLYTEIIENEEAVSVKDLEINGHDLLNLGIEGIAIKKTLNHLIERIIEEETLNNKSDLIAISKKINQK